MAAGVVNHALQALTSEQMVELLQLLDSDVRAKLERAAATSARKVGEGHKGGEGYKGAGDRRGGGKNGSGRGPGGKAGDWGKIGGGGGKGKGGHSGPVVLNFKPEALPPCTGETSEQVAFQAQIGTPWQLLGPDGSRFKWNLQPREVVGSTEKAEVRELLENYASANGLSLSRDGSLKLALRRGNYWISAAGGISSVSEQVAGGVPSVPAASNHDRGGGDDDDEAYTSPI
eukprot:gnl/TRDRNA2_/TRDRNA2_134520_c0_seq2.p1 gnl/TRDRNA2_/TRDRNA2_134520_c0~~gnl/TRDRNA2_/TRDRNA2_134520_c0_seq2.p1  ORF type:complete len:260 (-),score=57.43 gnl/TRDRNA2_/TRDRNA2_134520_c0_seq2:58-747(-)